MEESEFYRRASTCLLKRSREIKSVFCHKNHPQASVSFRVLPEPHLLQTGVLRGEPRGGLVTLLSTLPPLFTFLISEFPCPEHEVWARSVFAEVSKKRRDAFCFLPLLPGCPRGWPGVHEVPRTSGRHPCGGPRSWSSALGLSRWDAGWPPRATVSLLWRRRIGLAHV